MARDPNTPKAPRPKKKPKNKDVAPPPERTETPEERAERKRKAKGERRAKGEPLLREDGDKKCKICKEVMPTSKFSAAQLRKPRAACLSCCEARAQEDRPDHVPKSKSMRERREELKKFREEKKRKAKDEPKTTTPAKKAEVEPVAKRAKTENIEEKTDEKPAASHDEPAASGDGDETKNDGDETKNDADAPADEPEDDESRKRQIYVGGIPFYKTEEEIREAFDNENLFVESIDCMTFPDSGRFRGIAIVTFATAEAAKGALAWNNEEWEGKFLVVRKYAPKDGGAKGDAAKEDAPPREEVKKTEGQTIAFVANLDYSVTEEQLRTALVGCEVKEVRMGKDKETGEFKGFAHVEFVGDEDLEQAVSLSGTNLGGREMKIAYATARKPPKEERIPGRYGDKKSGKRDMRHKGGFKKVRIAKRG